MTRRGCRRSAAADCLSTHLCCGSFGRRCHAVTCLRTAAAMLTTSVLRLTTVEAFGSPHLRRRTSVPCHPRSAHSCSFLPPRCQHSAPERVSPVPTRWNPFAAVLQQSSWHELHCSRRRRLPGRRRHPSPLRSAVRRACRRLLSRCIPVPPLACRHHFRYPRVGPSRHPMHLENFPSHPKPRRHTPWMLQVRHQHQLRTCLAQHHQADRW
mmetsp:Transcript_16054/g.40865  ORF Transcript_16054/g.40865 Transcript_16054/m.40865 type:complete len:210 (+) Transcript_16054:1202-1831(+)